MIRSLVAALLAAVLLVPASSKAGPLAFDDPTDLPPVIRDSQSAIACTVTYLILDTANGDIFAQRIRVPPSDGDLAVNHRLPCPTDTLPRLSNFAREVCTVRAADRKTCVYADMSREFAGRPEISNTDADASRCRSDTANAIGAACWINGASPVCNVACGMTPAEALTKARSRCQEKQQRPCPASVVLPVADQSLMSADAAAGASPTGASGAASPPQAASRTGAGQPGPGQPGPGQLGPGQLGPGQPGPVRPVSAQPPPPPGGPPAPHGAKPGR